VVATLGIILDIVVIAVIVIFSLIGLKKGFFKSILSIFNFGLCLTIAILIAKYVAGWINGIYDFSNLIGNKIEKSLIDMNAFFAQSVNVFQAGGKDALIASIPNDTNKLLTQVIKVVFSNGKVDMTTTESIGSVVGASLGQICMIVIAGIITFIILRIAVGLLTKLFDKITKTKIIGGLNRILGLVLGLVKSILIIGIVNFVLVAMSLVPLVNKLITPLIQENTYVERVAYNATDKIFEKFVIEGDVLKIWVSNLWEKR